MSETEMLDSRTRPIRSEKMIIIQAIKLTDKQEEQLDRWQGDLRQTEGESQETPQ